MVVILLQMKKHFRKIINSLREIRTASISICSGLYINREDKLMSEFMTEAEDVFRIGIEKVDFSRPRQAVEIINNWVRFHDLL